MSVAWLSVRNLNCNRIASVTSLRFLNVDHLGDVRICLDSPRNTPDHPACDENAGALSESKVGKMGEKRSAHIGAIHNALPRSFLIGRDIFKGPPIVSLGPKMDDKDCL
jgi:hypothetical protein